MAEHVNVVGNRVSKPLHNFRVVAPKCYQKHTRKRLLHVFHLCFKQKRTYVQ